MQKKDQRTKETNKTDTRKNIIKTSERRNYNIFSILSQKEPRQESITNKKPKTQKTRIKGEKNKTTKNRPPKNTKVTPKGYTPL